MLPFKDVLKEKEIGEGAKEWAWADGGSANVSDNASLDKILDGTTLTISSSPTKKHLVASMPVLGSARVPADKVFRLQYTINMIVSHFMFSR